MLHSIPVAGRATGRSGFEIALANACVAIKQPEMANSSRCTPRPDNTFMSKTDMSLKDLYAEIDGLNIRYRLRQADPAQTPLLIFNGMSQSLETLQRLAIAFPERSVITYDAPGAGLSAMSLIPVSMARHARIAAGLLDKLGIETVDVLGISWGGELAQHFALRHGNRCRKLILAVTFAGGLTMIPGPFKLALEILIPLRYTCKRRMRRILPKLYGGDVVGNPDMALALMADNQRGPGFLRGYYSQMAASRVSTTLHRLPFLHKPTLLLSGTKDPMTPSINQIMMAKLIPGAKLITYDDGHMLLHTRHDRVVADIQQFLVA